MDNEGSNSGVATPRPGQNFALGDSARRAWDPTHLSASTERQVKIRACLDLATVFLTVPQFYRGILSTALSNFTVLLDDFDKQSRALKKLQKQKAKGELPVAYNSIKTPILQYQKGTREQFKETWADPAEAAVLQLKRDLLDLNINLLIQQSETILRAIDEQGQVKEAWAALQARYDSRPKVDHYRVAIPSELGNWPAEAPVFITTEDPLQNELRALQVDLPVYYRKARDLKQDLIERTHHKKEKTEKKKVEEKRTVDVEMQDVASSSSKELAVTVNNEVQRQITAFLKSKKPDELIALAGKVSGVSTRYHQDPANSISHLQGQRRQRRRSQEEGEEAEGEDTKRTTQGEEGQEDVRGGETLHPTDSQGDSPGEEAEEAETPSWRRIKAEENWRVRERKRESERLADVILSKPWTFGVPSSYPDEILSLDPSYRASVLLTRAPVSLLDANRFRSPIHVQPGLDVPIQIQHDLSASLKFMFETKIDKTLINKAYTDLVRRIRWKWYFMDKVGDEYDPDYDVSNKVEDSSKERKDPPEAHPLIERGLRAGQDYVHDVIESIPGADNAVRTPCPINVKRAQQFVVANNLIVTSTDKNLGVAVFKREWIQDQAAKLFDDAENYTSLTVQESLAYLRDMAKAIKYLCERHVQDNPQLSTFLSHCLPKTDGGWTDWKDFVPEAYAIPKIHKNPWKGRPICPGYNLPQNAASKVLAKLVRPFIETECPWVIKGSKDFVIKLGAVKIPRGRKCFIVSADVVAFYPSVDTGVLREILKDFAEKVLVKKEIEGEMYTPQQFDERMDYYSKLFEIAVSGPLMTWNEKILFQHKGLPMGAAGSPDAANLFAAWYEGRWMERVTSNDDILFYGRYLDDIYSIVLADTPAEALEMLSFITLGNVNLLWEPPSDTANFLDLSTRIEGDGIFHEPFVKAMSHRERIPWSSAHPLDVKKGTFSSEISRLATLCSRHETYVVQCQEAVNLYIGRGYPPKVVTSWLKSQQQKKWEDRIAVKAEVPTRTFFTLKTHFNDAWKHFHVGELETKIHSVWKQGMTPSQIQERRPPRLDGGIRKKPKSKAVNVVIAGPGVPGQSRLAFTLADGSDRRAEVNVEGRQPRTQLLGKALVEQKNFDEWVNTGKFLVSRKKNTQLWDVTRHWNESVWDNYLQSNGLRRPFDPTYEGLVILNEEDE